MIGTVEMNIDEDNAERLSDLISKNDGSWRADVGGRMVCHLLKVND